MARYRKIDPRMWGDEKFKNLSRIQPSGQALWIYLLTGPHTIGPPGLYQCGEAGMAEALGWPLKGFRERFRELFREGLVEADFSARVILIKNAYRYDPPDNPNVIKNWGKLFDEVPECRLKIKYYHKLKEFLEPFGKEFQEAFRKGFRKGLAIPEPEPEPEPLKEKEEVLQCRTTSLSSPVDNFSKKEIPFEEIISYLNQKTDKKFNPSSRETRLYIHARWNAGFRLDDFKKVIDMKTAQWKTDPKMISYLRPETLFGTKFESYLNEKEPSWKDVVRSSS